jgi:late competence protein required for DNA uptake (superfamily II DNA/RNA helicase)
MLQDAVAHALAPNGRQIWLTATPPKREMEQMESKQLSFAMVYSRYHGYLLPRPQPMQVMSARDMIKKSKIPQNLQTALHASLTRGARQFVFVPKVWMVQPLADCIREYVARNQLSHTIVEATSAQDHERVNKIKQFRNNQIRTLVTTTILERGVTVAFADVFIIDADDQLFSEEALVQMAGRAGRSIDDPYGIVWFCAREWTITQNQARRQIDLMNNYEKEQSPR